MYVIYPCVRLISDEFYLCSVTSLFEEIVIISTQVVVICHWGYCSVSVVISEVKSLRCVRLFATPPTRLLCPWDFPGKSTGVGCHALLQGIFPTQGSNLGLLHCRQMLYPLSHQGSPINDKTTLLKSVLS